MWLDVDPSYITGDTLKEFDPNFNKLLNIKIFIHEEKK